MPKHYVRRFALVAVVSILLSVSPVLAGTFDLAIDTNKAPLSYAPGEKMVFSMRLLEDGRPVSGKRLKWTRKGDDGRTEDGEAESSASQQLVITTSLGGPGFVHIVVKVLNADGSPCINHNKQPVLFEGGAGVEPGKLQAVPEPKDFDEFWKNQKTRLRNVPLKSSVVEVPSTDKNFVVYDVKVDCAGGRPASGYLTLPKGSPAQSIKALVKFQGYGVSSVRPFFTEGALTFNVNAHGIENGREAAYYADLGAKELKSYAMSKKENSAPETCYLNGMILRAVRAVEYVRSRSEWNGKDLEVSGGSQGGLQAVHAAALDPAVTHCVAFQPWFCDISGITLGRMSGWRPELAPGLPYYDPCNQAKRLRCRIDITAGLGDHTCPPSGITVLYNNINAPKRIEYIQGSSHSYVPKDARRQVFNSADLME